MDGSVAATDRAWRNGMETVMPDTGVVPPETFRMLSGLDLLRGMMEGRYPAAPITATLGFRLVEVAEGRRSEEHTSELQSLMRISYAVFCLKKKNKQPIFNARHTVSWRTYTFANID